MNFTVRLSADAAKKLARLDRPTRDRIVKRLEELENDPYDSLDRREGIVRVEAIQPRGQVYKRL